MVGPLPRQAEDRDVHAARQGAGRASSRRPSCARSARSRTSTAGATASSRPARTSSCTGSSSRSCPTSSRTSRRAGITTAGGCGDTVRNITGCPVQGIAADELFDATPIVDAAADLFYGNPDWANLPRKHKYSISACADRCNAPEINCISLIGTVTDDGREGFARASSAAASRRCRGSRRTWASSSPRRRRTRSSARSRRVWSEDLKYRVSRVKARLKFMVDDIGPEGIRERVEAQLGRKLEDYTLPPIDGRAVAPPRHPRRRSRRGSTTSASRCTSA